MVFYDVPYVKNENCKTNLIPDFVNKEQALLPRKCLYELSSIYIFNLQ